MCENFHAIDAAEREGKLGVEESVLHADVVAATGYFEREVAFLVGEPRERAREVDLRITGGLDVLTVGK